MKTLYTLLVLILALLLSTNGYSSVISDKKPLKKKHITIKIDKGVKIKVVVWYDAEPDTPALAISTSSDSPQILDDPQLDLELELMAEERMLLLDDNSDLVLEDEIMDLELEKYAEERHRLIYDDSDEVLEDSKLDKELEIFAEQRLESLMAE